jgi:hypothetical protein
MRPRFDLCVPRKRSAAICNLLKRARRTHFLCKTCAIEPRQISLTHSADWFWETAYSASRTQGLDDFDAEKHGENDAGDSRCPNGCPSEDASAASKPALNENNIPQQLSWEQLKEQSSMPDPVAAYLQLLGDTHGHPMVQTELDLAFLLTRWPNLPQHIRQTIMTLVRSVDRLSESSVETFGT